MTSYKNYIFKKGTYVLSQNEKLVSIPKIKLIDNNNTSESKNYRIPCNPV